MLTKEQIDGFEATHGEVVHCKGPLNEKTKEPAWEVVLKRPDGRKHYKVFRAMCNDEKQRPLANEMILRNGGMLVHPEVKDFDALLDQHFGICEASSVQKGIAHLLGLECDEVGKF